MEISLRSQSWAYIDKLIDSPFTRLGAWVVGSGIAFGLVGAMFLGIFSAIVF